MTNNKLLTISAIVLIVLVLSVLSLNFISALDLRDYFSHANGDLNDNGQIDMSDIYVLVDYLFRHGENPSLFYGDIDKNGQINVADITMLVSMYKCFIEGCYDSDAGLNYYLKGTCVDEKDQVAYDDECISGGYFDGWLLENTCDLTTGEGWMCRAIYYECPNGCSGGACVR